MEGFSPEYVRDIEGALKLPPGFLGTLEAESDWALVIKAHTLVDRALTLLLASPSRRASTVRVFASLPTSNPKIGKLPLVQCRRLLGPEYVEFVRGLSQLRNKLAHDVSNASFDLKSYVNSLQREQLRLFARWCTAIFFPKSRSDALVSLATQDPRGLVLASAFIIAARADRDIEIGRMRRAIARQKRQMSKSSAAMIHLQEELIKKQEELIKKHEELEELMCQGSSDE